MATPKVVLITGGNNGLGYETVKAFFEDPKPYHVLMGSRSLAKGHAAIEAIRKDCPGSTNQLELVELDVSSDESIDKAFAQVEAGPGHVDILINNAGATLDDEYTQGNVSLRECFNTTYDVNVTGANIVTTTFMPLLLKSTERRLIFIAGLSQITLAVEKYFPTPPLPAGWPKKVDFETIAYRCSKVAMSMLMLDWNHKLKEDKVKVIAVGPGFLATDLGGVRKRLGDMGAAHPGTGAVVVKSVAEGARDADMGKVVDKDGFVPV